MITRKHFMSGVVSASAGLVVSAAGSGGRPLAAMLMTGARFFSEGDSAALRRRVRDAGRNAVLVDVQDSVSYPSHPEIATRRSLDHRKAASLVEEWNRDGLVVFPLLDFCTANDSWLGVYDRMVCSKPYDALVKDLLADAYRIFAKPEYIHIGFSNEDRQNHPKGGYAVMRQGDLWMRYLARTSGWVKETGARTWAWFDYPWGMKDFLADCPRDILYSNLKPLSEKRTADRFAQVAGHGCDVAPFLRSDEDAAVAAKLPQTHVVGDVRELASLPPQESMGTSKPDLSR